MLRYKCNLREAATIAHKMGLGQSVEANEKRLQRLRRLDLLDMIRDLTGC
jgi:hypothetical protein